MHTKILQSFGMESLLELFVLGIIRRPVRYDENRLGETQRGKNIIEIYSLRYKDLGLILEGLIKMLNPNLMQDKRKPCENTSFGSP